MKSKETASCSMTISNELQQPNVHIWWRLVYINILNEHLIYELLGTQWCKIIEFIRNNVKVTFGGNYALK
jgi:hypothetical protein